MSPNSSSLGPSLGPLLEDPSAAPRSYNIPALVFGVALIVTITGGNVLVCASVYVEKALKTSTNYFIVSLAGADLLLALLVLPLYVYAEFQGGIWTLDLVLCDFLMSMDVMLCTASIFNLCAISVDRFIAVSVPLNYSRRQVDQRQLVLLCAPWLLALAVASPVMLGINNVLQRDPSECKLEDHNYVLYSSVCSFFVPCPVMLLLYGGVIHGLQRWERDRKHKLKLSIETCRKLQHSVPTPPPAANPFPRRGPCPLNLPRVIERDLAQCRMVDSGDYTQSELPYPREYRENHIPTAEYSPQKNRAKINHRERKAMRVLPVVVGCFMFCWTPFFVVHTTRALCVSCHVPAELISTTTWLGYVNSALNPIIYTIFNHEFKKFFNKCFQGALRKLTSICHTRTDGNQV
ncbi:D(4) dopamine receptor-like [Eucyclogobius newberryi]|uniref:D(4) dopamine receptor-like n=1 Tax=Eucyclogobius newberryi TaxID=166745 RepID=UPI003B5CC11F